MMTSSSTERASTQGPGFVAVEKLDTGVSKKTIAVSPSAVEAIRRQLDKRGTPDSAIRIGIRGGGCSGFSYDLYFEDKLGEMDEEFESNGVKLFVDPMSFQYLEGTEIDYVEGLHGAGFKFNNPNSKGSCGCGWSFSA